jgi:hypothetical protein
LCLHCEKVLVLTCKATHVQLTPSRMRLPPACKCTHTLRPNTVGNRCGSDKQLATMWDVWLACNAPYGYAMTCILSHGAPPVSLRQSQSSQWVPAQKQGMRSKGDSLQVLGTGSRQSTVCADEGTYSHLAPSPPADAAPAAGTPA